MWQSRKAFAVHKAIKNKRCRCAENFNWSCICPTFPRILKCVSVPACIFDYAPGVHHLVLARRGEAGNAAHPPLPVQAGKRGERSGCHQSALSPCATAAAAGRGCTMSPAPSSSLPFQLAAAGRGWKETLRRRVLCPLYLFSAPCSQADGLSRAPASAGQGGTLPCQRATGHSRSPLREACMARMHLAAGWGNGIAVLLSPHCWPSLLLKHKKKGRCGSCPDPGSFDTLLPLLYKAFTQNNFIYTWSKCSLFVVNSKSYYFSFRPLFLHTALCFFCLNFASLTPCSIMAAAKLPMLPVLVQRRRVALPGHSLIVPVVCMHFVWLKPLHCAGQIMTLKLVVFIFKDSKELYSWHGYLSPKGTYLQMWTQHLGTPSGKAARPNYIHP